MPDTGNEVLRRRCAQLEDVLNAVIAELSETDPRLKEKLRARIRAPLMSRGPRPVLAGGVETQTYLAGADKIIG